MDRNQARVFIKDNLSLFNNVFEGSGAKKDELVQNARIRHGFNDRDDSFVLNELLSHWQILKASVGTVKVSVNKKPKKVED